MMDTGKTISELLILGIETSCDETAVSVVQGGSVIRSNIIDTQIDLHAAFGGVVPEIASRRHIEKINPMLRAALQEAKVGLHDLDAIAVTYGPGLVGALLVGVNTAKALSYATGVPLVGVHHIEGHIAANYLTDNPPAHPFICLVASGGHSHLVLVKDYGTYEILGQTRDDAAGEAFDKVARAIGLGYPGGPKIDAAAKKGDPDSISFPAAKIADAPYDFSFSGLKSAVLNHINQERMKRAQDEDAALSEKEVNDIAASFQKSVVEVLTSHTLQAAIDKGCKEIAIAGGVASNTALRASLTKACEAHGFRFFSPPPVLCTDNAAMIACAGTYEFLRGTRHDLTLNAMPNLALGKRERRFHKEAAPK